MITLEQALAANSFHIEGQNGTPSWWRRNGKTKTWKTRPGEFRIPIKFGLYGYWEITHLTADQFHTVENCEGHDAIPRPRRRRDTPTTQDESTYRADREIEAWSDFVAEIKASRPNRNTP